MTRKKEHMDKVRRTQEDIANGNMQRAKERMNTGDGGLAKHNYVCNYPVRWEESRILGKERKTNQRRYLEGIESLKEKSKGRTPLNTYNQMEHWQPVIQAFMEID